jgi:hypothetical protein
VGDHGESGGLQPGNDFNRLCPAVLDLREDFETRNPQSRYDFNGLYLAVWGRKTSI